MLMVSLRPCECCICSNKYTVIHNCKFLTNLEAIEKEPKQGRVMMLQSKRVINWIKRHSLKKCPSNKVTFNVQDIILQVHVTFFIPKTISESIQKKWYVMRCAIWYHLYNLKYVKNTYGRMLLLVKLQARSLQLY